MQTYNIEWPDFSGQKVTLYLGKVDGGYVAAIPYAEWSAFISDSERENESLRNRLVKSMIDQEHFRDQAKIAVDTIIKHLP